ncbi:hypothetical protein AVEN_265119-1 [Araneus ventricosus]|uniref:C2H2-type domain-containing protein n=1 Tax=Araneus ventricosus TaxID=182803 RepID=A0A4Y2NHA4_ARAVE|nr:hypothetical protein AVEN_265119-1 [Araneus ventricosus]
MNPLKKTIHCKLYKESFSTVKLYTSHLRFHNHSSYAQFPCGSIGCSRKYSKFSSYRAHLSRDHRKLPIDYYPAVISLKCATETCQQKCRDKSSLISHLKKHINQSQRVSYPFDKCRYSFDKKSSFSSHLSRKHSYTKHCLFKKVHIEKLNTNESTVNNNDASETEVNSEHLNVSLEDMNKAVALFCLKLISKFHVSATVVDLIIDEICSLQKLNQENMLRIIITKFDKGIVSDTFKNDLLLSLQREDFLLQCCSDKGQLSSDYLRKSFFKTQFQYVEPIAISLGQDKKNKNCIFHYVPILESLASFIQNESVRIQFENPLKNLNKGILTDSTDGLVWKRHDHFNEKDFIKILLYQNSFETVNPLGSAKKKHKILAVYYTVGNLYLWNRSKINPLQLVLLCRQVDFERFGHEAVFRS